MELPYPRHEGWRRGDGQPLLPAPGLTLPPIDPSPPLVPPAVPPSAPVCNPSPAPGQHYQDSHEYEVIRASRAFCHRFANKIVHARNEHEKHEFTPGFVPGNDAKDDIYDFRLNSVPHCPAVGGYNLQEPIPGVKCERLLFDAWKKCEFGFLLSGLEWHNANFMVYR